MISWGTQKIYPIVLIANLYVNWGILFTFLQASEYGGMPTEFVETWLHSQFGQEPIKTEEI